MRHCVCPWWLGWLLISPLRRLTHDPDRIVGPYVEPGMRVVDFGCGMGHFSLPLARMVGPSGSVVCIDVQDKMLGGLRRRAAKVGLTERLILRRVTADDSGLSDLTGAVDFILAMFVVHEVPDAARLVRDLATALRPRGRLLFAEPVLHVRKERFLDTVATAKRLGLEVIDRPAVRRARAVLLARGEPGAPAL